MKFCVRAFLAEYSLSSLLIVRVPNYHSTQFASTDISHVKNNDFKLLMAFQDIRLRQRTDKCAIEGGIDTLSLLELKSWTFTALVRMCEKLDSRKWHPQHVLSSLELVWQHKMICERGAWVLNPVRFKQPSQFPPRHNKLCLRVLWAWKGVHEILKFQHPGEWRECFYISRSKFNFV